MHEPVMCDEVLEYLSVRPGGVYVDGTLGAGGHAEAVVRRLGDGGLMVGMDRDAEAVARSGVKLAAYEGRVKLCRSDFAEMGRVLDAIGIAAVDGVVLDLGLSSDQLADGARGFSFMADGPLDMRMDRGGAGRTAADIVNSVDEEGLRGILRDYGEERNASRLARAIIRARARGPIMRTGQLVGVIEKAVGGTRGRINPATRTFQALRIAVNDELGSLTRGLDAMVSLLKQGGRAVVISFHSLEDRLVKRCFAEHEGVMAALPEGGSRWEGRLPRMRRLTKRPVQAGREELSRNPRSRSAKLRAAERTEG